METEEIYEYGQTPTFKGTTEKEADAQYTYAFAGWDNEVVSVAGDTTYKATYTSTVNTYKVIWNVDGVITEETYKYGETPVFKGTTEKEADAQYTYTFIGWDNEVANVTRDVTYTATYTQTVNTYKVTWNVDGAITEEIYEYGKTPVYKGVLNKISDGIYHYNFKGWNESIKDVTGDVTYTAVYDSTLVDYTIKFVNEDGSILSETTYHYGETPSYKGATPTKEADETYTYSFKGWDSEVVIVTGDVIYTAEYNSTYIDYTIKFVNEDGSILSETTYHYGDTVIIPSNPTKDRTQQYTYTFASWDKAIIPVTSDATYKATYTSTINKYTVTFVDENDIFYLKELVSYGDTVRIPVEPTKLNHLFIGWYNDSIKYDFNMPITGDITLKSNWLEIKDVDIDKLVNESYQTITSVTENDKFEVSQLDNNEITVTILNKGMNTIEALEGTGIATVAENILGAEGVETVTLINPNTKEELTISEETLWDQFEDLLGFFQRLTGLEDVTIATSKDLIGKSINIKVNLSYGYKTSDNTIFKILFDYNIDTNELVENAYNTIKGVESNSKFEVSKLENVIKVTILDRTMNTIEALEGTGIATVAENILSTDGISSVTLINPNTKEELTIKEETLWDQFEDLLGFFQRLTELEDVTTATSKDLIGKSMNIVLNFEKGYDANGYKDFFVLFAEPDIHQVSFNTNGGNNVSPQLVYDKSLASIPTEPAKQGHTFLYWSLNGTEYDFDTPVTSDIELKAIWKLNQYNITFKNYDGSVLSNNTYYYGDAVVQPNTPTKQSTEIYSYIFKGWDKQINTVESDMVYTAVYQTIISVDTLVNNAYNTIQKQVETNNKFKVSKSNNLITVNILDTTMDSVYALSGTGIVTAAENILETEGIKSVTIKNSVTGEDLEITSDNLWDLADRINELFETIAGGADSTALDLVGKSIRITINIDDEYKTNDNNTFAISFISEVDLEEVLNKSYSAANEKVSNSEFKLDLNQKNIKVTILETKFDTISFITQSGIIYIIEELLQTDGVSSVRISIPNTENYEDITNDNFIVKIDAIGLLLEKLDGSNNFESGNLVGKEIEISLNLKDGFVSEQTLKFTISYDAIYTVTYNADGTMTTEKIKYNEKLIEPEMPTKEGYTFSHWELNGEKYNFNNLVTKDFELVAIFNINKYQISFVTNNDSYGSFNTTGIIVDYGSTISIIDNKIIINDNEVLAIPTQSDAQYTYTFDSWTGLPTNNIIVDDIRIIGNFVQTINTYKVTWNVDGEVTEEVYEYGQTPSYKIPLDKAADETYTYSFKDWDKPIDSVTEDVTYTALYDSTFIDYTVTFVDEDGSLISESTYHYGEEVTVPANPTKDRTQQYTYAFAGWDNEVVSVAGDTTYKATYTSTVNKYTVTFKNYDGTVLQTEEVEYDQLPEYTGETPIKDSDETYTYSFKGWDKTISEVIGDITYIAEYNSTYINYTVTFVNEDGSILSEKTYHYGETPIYTGTAPTKAGTAKYTYTFAGWDKNISSVIGDATYVATYTSAINKYTIKFVNYDGKELQKNVLEYGETPAYIGTTPIRPGTTDYNYVFVGWDKEVVTVTGNTVYTAIFKKQYTITFKNYNGTVLSSGQYLEGSTVTEPSTPTKPSDNTYNYIFDGWDKDVTTVSDNAEYVAQYKNEYIEYTIKFVNEDGTTLTSKTYHYGDMPTYTGSTPTKTKTAQYTYTFKSWDKTIVAVTGDTTYKATYNATVNKYTVTFKNADGTVLQTEVLEYGKLPEYNGSTPTREATTEYDYVYVGWNKTITTVTGDTTYTAAFKKRYTVTFKNADGTVLDTEKYLEGSLVTRPEDPTRPSSVDSSKEFFDWYYDNNGTSTRFDFDTVVVESNLELVAQYRYVMIVDDEVRTQIATVDASSSKFTLTPSDTENKVSVTFKQNYGLTQIKNDVGLLFHNIAANDNYSAVEIFYDNNPTDGQDQYKTVNIKDDKYDLLSTKTSDWYGTGVGRNDDITNWLGYLATGKAGTWNAVLSKTNNLKGKTVYVTFYATPDYMFENGDDKIVYELYFEE